MLSFVSLGTWQIIALIVIGVLLFGSRLPQIARSVGKSVVEFKKGVKDIKDDVDPESEPKKLKDDSKSSRELNAEKVEAKTESSESQEPEKVSS